MKNINLFSKIVEKAARAVVPGLLTEYQHSSDFVCKSNTLWHMPAVARVVLHMGDEGDWYSHDFKPEQMQHAADKLEEETGVKPDLVRISGNEITVYWLDHNALNIAELMRRDTPGSFANLVLHRDRMIGRRIELSASLITSYLIYIGDERQTGPMQWTIADIERSSTDGLVYVRLTPTDERVVIEDNYRGAHHAQASLSGTPYDMLDFHFVKE